MTEAEIRADERKRIVKGIERLTRANYSPSSIWRYYYPSATGDWVDLREVLKVVRGTAGVPEPTARCDWMQDGEADGTWFTGCGHAFNLEAGAPAENKMKFCCYCGKPTRAPGVQTGEVGQQ